MGVDVDVDDDDEEAEEKEEEEEGVLGAIVAGDVRPLLPTLGDLRN